MYYVHPVKMLFLPVLILLLQTQARASGDELRCNTPTEKTYNSMHLREALFMDQCHLSCIKKVLTCNLCKYLRIIITFFRSIQYINETIITQELVSLYLE